MNLVQLKYFQAVCTYGTVSGAAEFLHISQPSVSSAIKELEQEFKVTLFRRCHQGMTLTEAGETFFRLSSDLLSRSKQIEDIMNDLGAERKTLRLGVPPMIGSFILPKLFDGFKSQNDDIELEITESGRQDLLKKLDEDFLDMVFLPHDKPIDNKLGSLKISDLEIVCCVSKNNKKNEIKILSPRDLENIPLVLFKNSFFQTEEIKKWFADKNVVPDILMQTEQLSTVLSLVTNNIAAGFMFRSLAEATPDLVAIPTENPIMATVSLVWKKDAYFFNCMKKFKNYINENISNF